MEEREFFDERQERKPANLNCPHCQQSAEYEVTWVVRTKKRQLAGRADERDRARFAKARSYMLRKDDKLLGQLRTAKTATFIIFETPEEGIGFPLSLNGIGEGYDKLP